LLAWETKGLLIGEAADQPIVDSIMRVANAMEGVAHANGIITVHLASAQILVALSLEFADELKTTDIELKIAELEGRMRHLHPTVHRSVREAAEFRRVQRRGRTSLRQF
jgi:divalent metal cation (Fe/Co/Zn/Cd) transporter